MTGPRLLVPGTLLAGGPTWGTAVPKLSHVGCVRCELPRHPLDQCSGGRRCLRQVSGGKMAAADKACNA